MDTTLEDRRVTWPIIIMYGVVAALPGIFANLIYVYLLGSPSDAYPPGFNQEYMSRIGIFIFMIFGFLSYSGTAFWIARRNRASTLFNSLRLVFTGFLVEMLFIILVGIEYQLAYSFTLIVYLIGSLIASFTPLMLKGKRKHLKDWDAQKTEETEKRVRE